MRLGILSDTHDQVERAAQAVRLLADQGAEILVHCGDLTGPKVVRACALLPCYYVFGNNDLHEDALERAIAATGGVCLGSGGVVELAGKRIAVTHGDVARQVNRLLADVPDYLLFGHSHRPLDARRGATRLINPGALHRAEKWTVALLDLADEKLQWFVLKR